MLLIHHLSSPSIILSSAFSNNYLQQIFDTLINSYIDNNIGIAENFLSDQLSSGLRDNLRKLFSTKQMKLAGTGNAALIVQDKTVRSDRIFWLDRNHNDVFENAFFDAMDSFVAELNSTCYSGITGYEFHYTMYDVDSFYAKHIDQFRNNDSRQFSMVFYLNPDWADGDGGELCVYHNTVQQKVTPLNGRVVFFKSNQLPHEVLVTNKPRLSITGWLKKD